MKNKHYFTRLVLALIAIAVLLPLVMTVIFSLTSPEEMKAYMGTRNNRSDEEFMEVKISPKEVSLKQFYNILLSLIHI